MSDYEDFGGVSKYSLEIESGTSTQQEDRIFAMLGLLDVALSLRAAPVRGGPGAVRGTQARHHAVATGIEPESVLGMSRRYGRDTDGALISISDDEPGLGIAEQRVLSYADVRERLQEVVAVKGSVLRSKMSYPGSFRPLGRR